MRVGVERRFARPRCTAIKRQDPKPNRVVFGDGGVGAGVCVLAVILDTVVYCSC